MVSRFAWLVTVTVVALSVIIVFGTVAAAASTPSGERLHGQSTLEPVFDDTTGNVDYIMTPNQVSVPVHANPASWAPFYVPVYPAGSTVGTLQCTHIPTDNCPDHGPAVAAGAAAAALAEAAKTGVPSIYGPADGSGVLGHDHLLAPPGSGGDFNVAWEPILVLFTDATAANTHLTKLTDINAVVSSGKAFEVPLPQLTFHCEVVPEIVYTKSTPV